ncbi:MAG TPA: VOC family protein [Steroidobacteraceae bacterium]|nr:VOC family protein [Steroidobacteraceae bacterium]
MRISAHLNFDGTCAEAFRFYQRVLGGTLPTMLTYGESALAEHTPEHLRHRIVHATLAFAGYELLGADVMPQAYERPAGFSVLFNAGAVEKAQQIFVAFSEGGQVRLPFAPTFWSPGFGVVVDRFGTPWEVDSEVAQ